MKATSFVRKLKANKEEVIKRGNQLLDDDPPRWQCNLCGGGGQSMPPAPGGYGTRCMRVAGVGYLCSRCMTGFVSLMIDENKFGATFLMLDPARVYRLFDRSGTLLYVGVTRNWTNRRVAHKRSQPWWGDVCEERTCFEDFSTCSEALRRELEVIRTEHPLHNVAGVEAVAS